MDDDALTTPPTTRRALREAEAAAKASAPRATTRRELREAEARSSKGQPAPLKHRSSQVATATSRKTASDPVATPQAPPAPPKSSGKRRAASATAMVLAALFIVSVSLPALDMVDGVDNPQATVLAASGEPQEVVVDGAANSVVVSRDSYDSSKVPTVAAYAQTASTYNNYLGDVQWPFLTGVPITTDFGPRVPPCGGCSSFHKGIDMNPGDGSPIQAIANGVVTEVSATDSGGLGVYAVIEHTIDGETVSSVYAHMRVGTLAMSVGESVSVGQLVGNVGNTGQSTGPHLHFEILLDGVTPTDPFAWLTERVQP